MTRLFGEKLRSLRRQHAITQVDLAARLGLTSQGHLANLEAGHEAPSLNLVHHIALLFGVPLDYLLRDTIAVEGVTTSVGEPAPEESEVSSSFGAKMRALRLQRNLSQRDLARQLGLTSRAYMSNLEAGRKLPSLELIVKLADFFDVTIDYLVRDSIPVQDVG